MTQRCTILRSRTRTRPAAVAVVLAAALLAPTSAHGTTSAPDTGTPVVAGPGAAGGPVSSESLEAPPKPSATRPGIGAHWTAPVPGAVVEPFDRPARPWLAGHRGIDLAASPGDVVVAPAAGVITFAGQVGGKPVVVIAHGELRTTLEPARTAHDVGAVVPAGAPAATVSPDGGAAHCAPLGCLHWGVRRGADYLDPRLLLGDAEPVVLLPLG